MARPLGYVLFVDDEKYQTQRYADALRDAGFSVHLTHTTHGALKLARMRQYDVAVLDVMMSPGRAFRVRDTAGGQKTGLALARELRNILPEIFLVALTNADDPEVEAWFSSEERGAFLLKSVIRPAELPHAVRRILRDPDDPPRVFIVHGRDFRVLDALREFVENDLRWSTPIILSEQPASGSTVIEKLEHYGNLVDIVFVLATPDDIGRLSTDYSPARLRPRQNVVFEYGYFLARLGRRSGRVLLLCNGAAEHPSDIEGVVYVDVSDGIPAAAANIRKELSEWL